jgi:hypothetical protein
LELIWAWRSYEGLGGATRGLEGLRGATRENEELDVAKKLGGAKFTLIA